MGAITLSNIVERLLPRKHQSSPDLIDFDPEFYYKYYGDLHHLKSPGSLREHYLRHGKREGRWKTLAEATKSFELRFGSLPADFSANAYKLLNEDLARAFDHEWQYAFHYLEHGRDEGRSYKIETPSAPQKTDAWMDLFRLGDFIACANDWLDETPQTKAQGMRVFRDAGIERLAPLNLDHVFDPAFYRSAYGFDESISDDDLYRHWLEIGISQSLSANEENALRHIVVSRQFPASFDWQRYRDRLSAEEARSLRHRVDVLRHLFDIGFEKGLTKHIAGADAEDLFAAIGDYHLVRGHHHLAIAAYDRALAGKSPGVGPLHRRGDAYAALGKTLAAQADFLRAAANPSAPVWSAIHAARGAASDGSFEKSFNILADARPKWAKSAEYRRCVGDLLQQFFDAKTRSAMSLYNTGDRRVADAYLFETLREICARIAQLEDLPARVSPVPDGCVAILANQDLAQCKHYRVEQKLRQLRRAGLEAQIFDQRDPAPFIESLLGARAAIFYRVPAFPNVLRAILTAKALGIPTYYELDDLIFEAEHYPDTFESYEGQISRSDYHGLLYGVPLYRFAMALCDHGIASTEPLAKQIRPVVASRDCLVLRNGLDERNEAAIGMGLAPRPERETLSIFYGSGTKAHNKDFNDLAAPALLWALENYEHVRLVIVGYLGLRPEFDRFSARIKQVSFVSDLDQYWSLLAASDINLAVLSPGLMTDCKSEIKWLEAAILQVPSIVSATATYQEILEDGVDALIVENDAEAWTMAMKRLIEDRGLRRDMGAAARCKALENYSLDSAAALLREKFAPSALTEKKDARASRIKVLVCNVFFPPQSYGGATRVVQDNVDYLKDKHQDIELSVLASDEGVSPPGRLRFDQYRGVPVFRLSTPIQPKMDWRPFNAAHDAVFERVLDRVQPDLIHFHCIQRLTASVVEIALKRKIPYLVTVHDGWWISDHQFLIDDDAVLRLPSPDGFDAVPPPGVSALESIARRQRLAGLLAGAEKVISVSETFAEIYRRAGVENVISIPNGVSPIKPAARPRSRDGRLSLGHVGGRSAHKGATLIEAVLRRTAFDHLKLTMVDFKMEPGARSERIWGNTPVLLCGATPQDRVAELYATLDALLAPSIWPESFGLVAREAQAQGLWVIASDRGAVGEGIAQGENGFVIDVADSRGLTEVLKRLDGDVARYRSPPRWAHAPPRTAADQGAELAELYRSITDRKKKSVRSSIGD